jgi:hypothetical protein
MHGPIKPGTFEPSPTEAARRDLLAVSEENSDGGELVGRDPREVPSEILLCYHKAKSPLRAIRERCLDCCCDVRSPQVHGSPLPKLAIPHGHQPIPREASAFW